MSFLDRFKRKAQDPVAPEGEADPKTTMPGAAGDPASAPAERVRPTRRAPDPAVRAAASGSIPGPADMRRPAPAPKKEKAAEPAPGDEGEMTLDLGDFLRRIPQAQLKPGTHDPKTPLKFNLSELAERIARGHTTIPLHEVYKRVPDIFAREIPAGDQTEIRFPWQKVMKLLAEVANATPTSGLSPQSAETLAEKLKSRRAVRNIVPGQAGTAEMKAAADAKTKSGRETRLKSGIEPVPKKPTEGSTPAVPLAPATAPLRPPAAGVPVATPEPSLELSSAADDENATRDDLIKARDAARLAAARVKGDYERQLAAALQDRKILAEERDRVAAELAKARKEVEDKLEQVEFEKSVASRSGENLARLQQERDALERELTLRERERETLRLELAKSGSVPPAASAKPDPRLTEITAERNSLLEQTARLSSELGELRKAAAKPTGPDPSMLAALTAQSQRAGEEFQQRISALESSHRTAEQELQRERETRTRAEQQLAAAEKARQEALARHEAGRTAQARDLEATAAKREAELHQQLTAVSTELDSAKQKLAAEFEQTRAGLTAEAATIAKRADEEKAAAAKREAELNRTLTDVRGELDSAKQKLSAELEQTRAGLTAEAATIAKRSDAENAAAAKREAELNRTLTDVR